MRIIALLLLFFGITLNAAPFVGAKREAFTAVVPASGGGASFPTIPGIYARYYSGSWSGFANGNSVVTWTNSSGAAPDLITGNAASRGYWTNNNGVANGKPWLAVPISGTTSYTNALVTTANPMSIFVLFRADGTPNNDRMFDSGAGGAYYALIDSTSGDWEDGNMSLYPIVNSGNLILYEFSIHNNGGGTSAVITNAVVSTQSTGNFTTEPSLTNPFSLAFKRFGSGDVYNYWEIVIYTNGVISGANLTSLRSYFTSTYGVP